LKVGCNMVQAFENPKGVTQSAFRRTRGRL
jgi:hypothetical protein